MALHQQPSFFEAVVPYKSIIRGGLQPGKVIIVQGIINSQAQRIEFNLHHKFGIAFHYNPRFDQNVVVRNTFENGKWGDVEEQSGPMPFKRGEQTLVTIFCSRDHYKVFVNGEETHTYNHRFTKLEEIDVLEVSGDRADLCAALTGISSRSITCSEHASIHVNLYTKDAKKDNSHLYVSIHMQR